MDLGGHRPGEMARREDCLRGRRDLPGDEPAECRPEGGLGGKIALGEGWTYPGMTGMTRPRVGPRQNTGPIQGDPARGKSPGE